MGKRTPEFVLVLIKTMPPHVATNEARKRSKRLRLATVEVPENFQETVPVRNVSWFSGRVDSAQLLEL